MGSFFESLRFFFSLRNLSYTLDMDTQSSVDVGEIFAIERPASSLMTYYVLSSFLLGPFFIFALIPLFFRYHTLRYRFDSEGISMRWGVLFRREINLTYARIQDIHLRSNVLERWMGLARIEVQTASGSSGAEMTLEGLLEFEAIREYLYTKMRGGHHGGRPAHGPATAPMDTETTLRLTETLQQVSVELRGLRRVLEDRDRSRFDG